MTDRIDSGNGGQAAGTYLAKLELTASTLGTSPDLVENVQLLGQDARALIDAAERISDAETGEQLARALDHNLRLWVAIRTAVADETNRLPAEVKGNLRDLAEFVAATTLSAGRGELNERRIQTLANIDLRIAEGLTKAQQYRVVQERAYELWESEGRPDGRAEHHWCLAEQELRDRLGLDILR